MAMPTIPRSASQRRPKSAATKWTLLNIKTVIFTHHRAILGFLVRHAKTGYSLDDDLVIEYNDKVKTVLDRFDSLTGEAGQYKSFSGIADGMKGKVKFIFQTAEIKNED